MKQVKEFFEKLLDSSDWPPRWHCGIWSDFHGWLYIISDLLIWAAYFTIPIVIIRYILKKQGVRFERLYLLFAAFILTCGATHFLDAAAFWVPLYRLSALVRFITAIVSWFTVYYLVKLMPVLFSLKSQNALEAEIRQRKQAEEKFKTLLEATPDALIIADKNGVITLVNRQTELLFGYAKSELTGESLGILVSETDKKEKEHFLKRFFLVSDTTASNKRFELSGLQRNGHEFPAEVNVSRIQLEGELYLCAAIRDISERIKQEKEIKEMAVIISSSSDAIVSNNIDGTILTWNKGAETILGYTYDEVKGKNMSFIYPPELLWERKVLAQKILDGETVEQHETIRVRKNQSRINVSITLSPIKNNAGEVVGNTGILRDTTRQKKAELELQESNRRNKIFIQEAPLALAMFDKEMRYMAASKKWVADYDLEGKDIIGHSHYDIFPEIGEDWKTIHKECLQGKINQCDEAYFERVDGSAQWITWDVRPWFITPGDTGGLIMYTADITKIKQKEAERKRIETILDISNRVARISTFEVNPKTEKLTLSPIGNEIFEFPENFQPDYQFLVSHYKKGERLDRLQQAVQLSMREQTSYDLEVEIVTAKGKNKWLRMIGHTEFRKDSCIRRFGVLQDITKSKRIEQELNFVNEELNTILNAGYVSIIGTDHNGLINHYSKGAELLLQYTAEEVIGIHTPALIHVEEEMVNRSIELSLLLGKTIARSEIFTHLRGDYESGEWTFVRKDGSTFPVQLNVSAIKNEKGEITGFLRIATDITEACQQREELQHARQQAEQASLAKSEFLANMSHEIRTPLNGVIGFTDLLLKTALDTTQQQYLSIVHQSADTLLSTINDILDFSKIEAGKLELAINRVDLYEICSQAADIVVFQAHAKGLEMLLNIAPDLPRFVYVDSVRLKQVLVNLLGNAVKFTEKGEIELKVTALKGADPTQGMFSFQVTDTGIGIKQAMQERIFEAFSQEDLSTTKKYGGTGLGLTISNKLLGLMGSQLALTSTVGRGSCFYFSLPLQAEDGPVDRGDMSHVRHVLIVDDNDHNRLILRQMFLLKQIQVDEARNGFEALQLVAQQKSYDVILVDYHMPNMDGLETIEQIRRNVNPADGQPWIILLHSSSDDERILQASQSLAIDQRLVKPLKLNDLVDALSRLGQPALTRFFAPPDTSAPPNQLASKQMKVLLVDDNRVNQLLAKTIVSRLMPQSHILEAINGVEAVALYRQEQPDLILMDIQMPELNGYEATKQIRDLEEGPPIPIIALTAGMVKGEREKCLAVGMDDFLSKPIVEDSLMAILEKWIAPQARLPLTLPASAINQVHFDGQLLYKQADDDKTVIREFIETADQELEAAMGRLFEAAQTQNLDQLKALSHKLRGTALSAGMPQLAKQTYVVECLDTFDEVAVRELLISMELEINLIRSLMSKTLHQL